MIFEPIFNTLFSEAIISLATHMKQTSFNFYNCQSFDGYLIPTYRNHVHVLMVTGFYCEAIEIKVVSHLLLLPGTIVEVWSLSIQRWIAIYYQVDDL